MRRLVVWLIRFYQRVISPCLPPACRYQPTCSEYALAAFQKYRLPQALFLSLGRILRCNPWHPGGYDPLR